MRCTPIACCLKSQTWNWRSSPVYGQREPHAIHLQLSIAADSMSAATPQHTREARELAHSKHNPRLTAFLPFQTDPTASRCCFHFSTMKPPSSTHSVCDITSSSRASLRFSSTSFCFLSSFSFNSFSLTRRFRSLSYCSCKADWRDSSATTADWLWLAPGSISCACGSDGACGLAVPELSDARGTAACTAVAVAAAGTTTAGGRAYGLSADMLLNDRGTRKSSTSGDLAVVTGGATGAGRATLDPAVCLYFESRRPARMQVFRTDCSNCASGNFALKSSYTFEFQSQ